MTSRNVESESSKIASESASGSSSGFSTVSPSSQGTSGSSKTNMTSTKNAIQSNVEVKEVPSRSLPFEQFVWGAGIECSFLPHLNVDQFEWTQHDRYWKDDFKR